MFFTVLTSLFLRLLLAIVVVKFIGPIFLNLMVTPVSHLFTPSVLSFCIIMLLITSLIARNPVSMILLILLSFILSAVFLFSIHVEFVVFTFLIVYIGAVMMLFLFVVMLFNLQNLKSNDNNVFNLKDWRTYVILFCLFMVFVISEYISLKSGSHYFNISDLQLSTFYTSVGQNGAVTFRTMYTLENGILFIFLSLLLLFTMISAIANALLVRV